MLEDRDLLTEEVVEVSNFVLEFVVTVVATDVVVEDISLLLPTNAK